MTMSFPKHYFLILVLGMSCGMTLGQSTKPRKGAKSSDELLQATAEHDVMITTVTEQLNRSDQGEQDRAIATIGNLIRNDFVRTEGVLRTTWLKTLFKNKRYDAVADLSLLAILADPSNSVTIESLQTMRVRSFLAVGKNEEALVEAKSLFNVSSMKGTGDALLLIGACLTAIHGDNPEIVEQFRREQAQGIKIDESNKATTPSRSSIIDGIKIDTKIYDDALANVIGEDYKTLCARGNLLLLAGRATEAKNVFEQAYPLASEKELIIGTENIARAMKAEDGTIGRANAWVLSLRPKNVRDQSPEDAPTTTPADLGG